MMVAFELKMTMSQFYAEVDQEEMGWWVAFFQLKAEREEKDAKRKRRRNKNRGPDD